MNENRQVYTDLEDRLTKKYYREIVEKALAEAKEQYEQFPNDRMNISFYHQLLDIKKTVIDDHEVYTEDEAYKKYPMAIMVVRNFLGEEADTAYAKMLQDIVWGISLYPAMIENIEMIRRKLFDGDEEKAVRHVFAIENQTFKLIDFYNNPLRGLKKEIGERSFNIIMKESTFSLVNSFVEKYLSEDGLEIHYVKKNEAIYLFSYGEYQPGRYLLYLEGICYYAVPKG
ncbi:hypothetical protein B0A69_19425 [Chryseobacterium shigense]|uniref:Uncharacterized protein n=1 Tax=Chryseobacterium shigense TaxID=297244 RepID=A0A1N7HZD2_9FLAO|nr:hypothetical protein [Chryseobacterium shigense]PQA90906.1 hypothetical protein B0A69_19425 [Chryseobacterium shigense]SIS30205.1 hypothetical protein SAMN05421639_101754 [Chryseobacterium shigense]